MYFLKLGIFVVAGCASDVRKGLSKDEVCPTSPDVAEVAGLLCWAATAEAMRVAGNGCLVQLRRAGPAEEVRGRIVARGDVVWCTS